MGNEKVDAQAKEACKQTPFLQPQASFTYIKRPLMPETLRIKAMRRVALQEAAVAMVLVSLLKSGKITKIKDPGTVARAI